MKNLSKEERARRSLLIAPLLILPFLTLAFWVLGGGRSEEARDGTLQGNGFKIELPGANSEDKPMDKLSYYDKARTDSLKQNELRKNDPYYQNMDTSSSFYYRPNENWNAPLNTYKSPQGGYGSVQGYSYTDPNEAKVYERLNSLNAALNQQSNAPVSMNGSSTDYFRAEQGLGKTEVDRLEKMMKMSQEGNGEPDPELQQLSGMLEKILDIQHPERLQEQLRKNSELNKGQVFSVMSAKNALPVSLLEKNKSLVQESGFYSIDETLTTNEVVEEGLSAVVAETQVLVNGAVIKLRLTGDIFINGMLIPKDNFIFGLVNLNGERLTITIDNVRYKQAIFPVKLSVYDLDGIIGVHIPGAISRDVAKQSSDNTLQGISMTSLDPSLGAQAASAGIEITKSFLGKKVKLVKVTVKAGYQVILKDQNVQ